MSYIIEEYRMVPMHLPMGEVYRYMGAKLVTDELQAMIEELLPQFLRDADCRACYMEVPVQIFGKRIDMDVLQTESADLTRNLQGCDRAVLFAATIGHSADRQRYRATVSSPTKALALDAMGSALAEVLCDQLCEMLGDRYPQAKLHPRFSPGYGDLPLALQKELLQVLDAHRRIGVTLSDSLLMIPQKAVSAIMGIETIVE